MIRYIMYENDNGIGVYPLESEQDAEEFVRAKVKELKDDPQLFLNIYIMAIKVYPLANAYTLTSRRIWLEEWEKE